MEKAGDDASKFIQALIKSVQTLCHGYLDFQNGIEIIGHINLSVDKGSSLDYILKEKVCKNAENSTLFISNSFHAAEPKSDQEASGKQGQTNNQTVQNSDSELEGSGKVSSAISSISSALTGAQGRRRDSDRDLDSSYTRHRTAKRKASSDPSGDMCPPKVPSHHNSSQVSPSPYRPESHSPVDSKLCLQDLHSADGEASETLLPQTASVTTDDLDVNLAGSVLEPVENQSGGREEDSDNDLEVTFIKEEYVEGDRGGCDFDDPAQQYVGGPHERNSEGMVDPSYSMGMQPGSSSSYMGGTQDSGGQQYSQPQPGPSGARGPVLDYGPHSQGPDTIQPGTMLSPTGALLPIFTQTSSNLPPPTSASWAQDPLPEAS